MENQMETNRLYRAIFGFYSSPFRSTGGNGTGLDILELYS